MADEFREVGIKPEIIDVGESEFKNQHIPMIKAFCISRRIRLIHANTVRCFAFPIAAGELGIPCFWHIHEMFADKSMYKIDDNQLGQTLRYECSIGMISDAARLEFSECCRELGFEAPQTAMVKNGVTVPDEFSLFPTSGSNEIDILSMSNYTARKGLDYLIDAFKIICDSYPQARLTILGEEGGLYYFKELYDQAERLDIDSRIRFLTAVKDVGPILGASDIAVNSSLMENLSMSVAEAMAYGKAVVATDVGGTRELLLDGETGLLVPPRNPEAIAEAISTFIEDPEFAKKCGERARARIEAEFSLQRQVAQLEEIYLSLLSSANRPETEMLPQDMAKLYDLLSEALVSINEKFHEVDERLRIESRDTSERLKHINIGLTNTRESIKTLETAVNSIFQKLPFRIYAKLKSLFSQKT
jgi:glycosyltransferase involved in cell wall biosynthesis